MVGNDLFLVCNDSMCYELHLWVRGQFISAKRLVLCAKWSLPHRMQHAVCSKIVVHGGGDIVFSAKRSSPCSMQSTVCSEIVVHCGGDSVLGAKRLPPLHIQHCKVVRTLSLVHKGHSHAVHSKNTGVWW